MVSQGVVVAAVLMGVATAGVRLLPFLLGDRLSDPALRRLFADLFPPAVLAVLIAYMAVGGEAPASVQVAQAAGAAVTAAAHLALRNLLVSVASGTAVCMLVQNLWLA
ncbi:AzlD domain-containing protein [Azospirillum sp.]|uniref:AzlD domain-containing protein n=1 Tax=Azospirillum sp. TaxID=34012 RepID=UPI003D712224